eukprot:CAMPEP_0176288422 /NCGR_PEP_ID=MMETSP0121_2-20121125/53963_1 /TAXON_ID=160619 /ORGANISM="Kryptoperidinium foliaceum, Strain CCMP 1326" /LENGTH=38 /DNA_ID= /DNA_START= /DNA_END= /DNA_ORIENTATION=
MPLGILEGARVACPGTIRTPRGIGQRPSFGRRAFVAAG